MVKQMVGKKSGFRQEAHELRRQAASFAEGSTREHLQKIADDFDELAEATEMSSRVARRLASPAKIKVARPAESFMTRLCKSGGLAAAALLLLSAPAWCAGAGISDPPLTTPTECTSQECMPQSAPGSTSEGRDQDARDGAGTRIQSPASAGAGGLAEDRATGTSRRPTPRMELPNNDAGLAPHGG